MNNDKPNFLLNNYQNRFEREKFKCISGPDLDSERTDLISYLLFDIAFGKHFQKFSALVAEDKLRV